MRFNKNNMAVEMTTNKEKLSMYYTYKSYLESKWDDVTDAYKTCSEAKKDSYWRHVYQGKRIYGSVFNPKVISRNTNFYTMGYLFPDAETGEMNFMYITVSKFRYVHISDLEQIENNLK